MFKRLSVLVLVIALLGSTGCTLGRRSRLGGIIGATAGAGIGLAAAGPRGALVGGLVGYAAGAGTGAVLDDKAGELERPVYGYGPYGYGGPVAYGTGVYGVRGAACNFQCSPYDVGCEAARGHCQGVQRALRDRAQQARQHAQEEAYCQFGGPRCPRYAVQPASAVRQTPQEPR